MQILSIVGRSGSGKTTLLERLIPALQRAGLRVAALKHSHHRAVVFDQPGKDSDRFRVAGADAVLLATPDALMQVERRSAPPTLEELKARLPGCDLLLVESWKTQRLECLEVVGDTRERIDPDACGRRLALVADCELRDALPRFRRDDVAGIAAFVLAWVRGAP